MLAQNGNINANSNHRVIKNNINCKWHIRKEVLTAVNVMVDSWCWMNKKIIKQQQEGEKDSKLQQATKSTAPPYLSFSVLLKPGKMFLKLLCRSSFGWLLVRLMEPFSLRLRKPWTGSQRKGLYYTHRFINHWSSCM